MYTLKERRICSRNKLNYQYYAILKFLGSFMTKTQIRWSISPAMMTKTSYSSLTESYTENFIRIRIIIVYVEGKMSWMKKWPKWRYANLMIPRWFIHRQMNRNLTNKSKSHNKDSYNRTVMNWIVKLSNYGRKLVVIKQHNWVINWHNRCNYPLIPIIQW